MATSDPGEPGPLRRWRATLREDSVAGLVLGVQSVPDGLATGLLAGVNPLAGLYAYVFGTFTGALFTGSAFMAVQATGAMSMVVADVPAVHDGDDPAGALFTLSVLTGIVMLAAGLLRLGYVLRFVSNAVMVGFLAAVGVNIVLGQLSNFTGYDAQGANRVTRASTPCCIPLCSTPRASPSASGRWCSSWCSSAPASAPSAWWSPWPPPPRRRRCWAGPPWWSWATSATSRARCRCRRRPSWRWCRS